MGKTRAHVFPDVEGDGETVLSGLALSKSRNFDFLTSKTLLHNFNLCWISHPYLPANQIVTQNRVKNLNGGRSYFLGVSPLHL